jgi:hypothetical protein
MTFRPELKNRSEQAMVSQPHTYAHTLSFEIEGIKIESVLIDFMPNLNVVLLGVKSFLSNFILTVDYKKSVFSLKQK